MCVKYECIHSVFQIFAIFVGSVYIHKERLHNILRAKSFGDSTKIGKGQTECAGQQRNLENIVTDSKAKLSLPIREFMQLWH